MNTGATLKSLTRRLTSLKRYILLSNLGRGIAIIIASLLALFFVAFLLNSAFFLTSTARLIYIAVSAVIVLGLAGYYIIWRFVRQPSADNLALRVEATYPELQDRLIASLQLERNLLRNREGYSTDMIEAVMRQSSDLCESYNFKKSVNHGPLWKALRFLGLSAAIVVLMAFIFPGSFNESLYLFGHPTVEIERHLSYALDVLPKDSEIAKYEPITIQAVLHGRNLPTDAVLHWRYQDGPVLSENLKRESSFKSSGLAGDLGAVDSVSMKYDFREVRRSFQYWVSAGEIQSDKYQINAVDKPRIIGIKLTYNYPKYTGLQPLVVDENDGNISAIKGTRVKIEAAVNKQIESAKLVFANKGTQDLEIRQNRLLGEVKVLKDDTYHIEVQDAIGNENPNPIEYTIGSIADLYPEADLYYPGAPVELGDDMRINMAVKLFDDFGFSKLNLVYRVYSPYGDKFERKIPVSFDKKAGRSIEVRYAWDLSNIGLEPGGMVEYFFEVYDNDDVSGPKRGVSQILRAKFPSLDEQFSYLEDEGKSQVSDLEQLRRKQEELLAKTQKLKEQILNNSKVDYDKSQEMKQAMEAQQQLMDQMKDVSDKMAKMQEQMRQKDLTSLEVLQKLQEIKKLFDEVATDKMKQAMKQLQDALKNMSPEEMQKAAEKMQLSQEELLKKLERTLSLLKFMQAQQKMETMMRKLADLIQKQESVNKQTGDSPKEKLSDLSPQEQRNEKSFEDLQKDADELKDLLKEIGMQNNEAAQEFMKATKQSQAGQKMQKMTQQLSQQQQQKAQKSGEMALNDLKAMQQMMQQQKENFSGNMNKMSAEKMRKAADEVLYVSEKQEDIYDASEQMQSDSPQLQQVAADQQAIQKTMDALQARLDEISKESPFFKSQVNELMQEARTYMDQSTDALMRRSSLQAQRSQKDAMFSLNQAANQIMQSMQSQKMCNKGSCQNENLFQQMNKLQKQQQQLNTKTQSMCNNPGQGHPKQGDLGRLAAQQDAIRKSMAQLQREQGSRSEILGRLDKLGDEMKKVVEDLESGNVGDETYKRQYKIYSRMLDFQKSLERQDYSEERRAQTAQDIFQDSPPPLQFKPGTRQNYQDRLQKYMNEGYPVEYEELIKEYFRSVNNGNQPQANQNGNKAADQPSE